MRSWRALLVVYRELNVRLSLPSGRVHFHHLANEADLESAIDSFRGFPKLAGHLTAGLVKVDFDIAYSPRPLRSLSPRAVNEWWPSPDDTRRQIDHLAPAGDCDSIFIFWPQHDLTQGTSVPGFAWGLGMGASDWSNGATYATVANAAAAAWQGEAQGEVWLHEWLHGVCHHFAQRGIVLPERDADGAELHGYTRSPTVGWTEYYRDLMTGNVLENGDRLGISARAWEAEEAGEFV